MPPFDSAWLSVASILFEPLRGIQVSGTFPALSTPRRKPKKSGKR